MGTFDTAEEGIAACQQRLGVLSDGPAITVAAVHARWLESQARRDPRVLVDALCRDATGAFVEAYGTEPANAITKAVAEDWVQAHPWHYGALQAMFNYAADRLDALPASPFKGKRPARVKGSRRALSEPELLTLAELARERHGVWHRGAAAVEGLRRPGWPSCSTRASDYLDGRAPTATCACGSRPSAGPRSTARRHTKGRRERAAALDRRPWLGGRRRLAADRGGARA